MCMDTLLLRVEHASEPGRAWAVVHQYIPQSRRAQARMGGDVYAPMSTVKQSLSVVMSDQVETLWVNSSRWNGGWEIPLPPPPYPNGCQGPHIHHNSLILNSCELTHIRITDKHRSALRGPICPDEPRKFMNWLCEMV